MAHERLTADDLVGVVGILPTPARPGSERWDLDDTLDAAEAARAVDAVIRDGVDALLTNGTFGEMAGLTQKEWRAYTATAVEAAAGRVPLFLGATALNTRDTIANARYLRDLGADGVFLGRPMWCELSEDAIVRFYQDIAEAVPELAIVVYDNPEAFKGRISTSAWRRLSRIPQVIGAKYMAVDRQYRQDLLAVEGRIRLMPVDAEWFYAFLWEPEAARATWSGGVACDPAPVIALRDSLFEQPADLERARQLADAITEATFPMFPNGSFHEFSKYNVPIEKIRMDAAGYLTAGPSRPPYDVIPAAYAENAREAGRRWRRLAQSVREGATPPTSPLEASAVAE